jgi:hypothetical protein
VVLGVNQAANGYNVLSSTGIALTSLTTPTVFTPIIDSGTTGSLSLKTNNGTTGFQVFNAAGTVVNNLAVNGSTTGASVVMSAVGTDANIPIIISSKGNSAINFFAEGANQFQVLDTSGATRNITVTGSNGGNPTISTTAGNLAVGTVLDLGSTGQLQFPATQNPSAGVNVLDDYEEGTWVPSVGGSATYLAHNGFYTKIGNTVFIRAQITVSAVGTGSTTVISGLPFTSDSTVPQVSSVISAEVNAGSATNIVSSYGVITAGGTSVTLQSRTAASAADSSNAIFGTNTAVTLSGTYHTAT